LTLLHSFSDPDRLVAASGARTATLAYDPLGRLWQISAPSGTTRFVYDGDDLIQEYDGNGNLLRDYDHASGADEPLIWHEYAGGFSRRFLHADQQGSIVGVTDTSGNAIAINSYDPWGVPGPGNAGRFQYTGQAWLAELGLYYYKARIYSPTLGRFLQVDTIGYQDQNNLYAYVGNDPVGQTDPSGKDAIVVTDTDGTKVVIIPVKFTGSGATPEYIAAAVASFNSTTVEGGGYKLIAIPTSNRIGGVLNTFRVEPGKPVECLGPSACANRVGGDKAYADSTSGHAVDSAGHELPHLAGVRDRYTSSTDSAGNRVATADKGYENNSMGNLGKRSLNQEQMQEIEDNHTTKVCEGLLSDLEDIKC
jgi:RHS repeat-associated protein